MSMAMLGLSVASPVDKRACDSGLHIIVARASTEAPGPGYVGNVANAIKSKVAGSTITAVDYPATLDNYESSESAGVVAMTKLVTEYGDACPTSRIVLIGFSQV